MINNRPPASDFQNSERETGNQVSLALQLIIFERCTSFSPSFTITLNHAHELEAILEHVIKNHVIIIIILGYEKRQSVGPAQHRYGPTRRKLWTDLYKVSFVVT